LVGYLEARGRLPLNFEFSRTLLAPQKLNALQPYLLKFWSKGLAEKLWNGRKKILAEGEGLVCQWAERPCPWYGLQANLKFAPGISSVGTPYL
jgi:hypothetical protein